ncbi:Hypp2392 [Branchiostoma lanceolatum]|uniref:Hypp2392 protein n=1 Tax=Branchiostoma lanceolatum TaxID=7740 RepID=A0A8J9ZQA9_BRALA|nr:Hypp2392 [Branchiostoma lanceolatum]
MAAAAAPTMVCFLDVDPSFQVVMNAIRELHNGGRLRHVCTVRVGNSKLRSAGGNDEFGGPNGFSRTLGSTLRAFMLRSTCLEGQHDPAFDGKTHNLDRRSPPAEADYYCDTQPQGAQLPLVNNAVQAEEISANFDRLYPHFHIENKLKAVKAGSNAYIPGSMVIVEQRAGDGAIVKLHTINATVRARSAPEEEDVAQEGPPNPNRLHRFECPNPSVVRVTVSLDLQAEDDFPSFQLLEGILGVKTIKDKQITKLVKKLQKMSLKKSKRNEEDEPEESDVTSGESTEEEQRPQASDNETKMEEKKRDTTYKWGHTRSEHWYEEVQNVEEKNNTDKSTC